VESPLGQCGIPVHSTHQLPCALEVADGGAEILQGYVRFTAPEETCSETILVRWLLKRARKTSRKNLFGNYFSALVAETSEKNIKKKPVRKLF
jgi:hypothetical protein